MGEVVIPFFGEAISSYEPSLVSDFIGPEDKIPLLLALSLYKQAVPEIHDFILIPESNKGRFAAWVQEKTKTCVIGCRGTSFGAYTIGLDLLDDKVSLFFFSFNHSILQSL